MTSSIRSSACALGFHVRRSGAVVVAVHLSGADPQIALRTFIPTAEEGDRLALEPYHVAVELCPKGEITGSAREAVQEGRRRQVELATRGLHAVLNGMKDDGHQVATAALLGNRAGWMDDLLSYSVAFADHPPVAEGLAVRDAFRSAFMACNVELAEFDEKSLSDLASHVLGRSEGELSTTLKALGSDIGPPWRKEQKTAALAAWVALCQLD